MDTKNKKQAEFRFYEELNDFLPSGRKKHSFIYEFYGSASVKDAIEANNVPHIEVDLIIVNGMPVGFDYLLKEGDRVAVYPVFESFDISGLKSSDLKPLRNVRFVNDVHLGKLTRLLRMTGFDTAYRNDLEDDEIIRISIEEQRIILTRDLGILKNKKVQKGYFLRSQQPEEQLMEVILRFQLQSKMKFLSRCIVCNGIIEKTDKSSVESFLKPLTKKHFSDFYRCRSCGKVYWEGSHFNKMKMFFQNLKSGLKKSFSQHHDRNCKD